MAKTSLINIIKDQRRAKRLRGIKQMIARMMQYKRAIQSKL
jgi:hypothetical protein